MVVELLSINLKNLTEMMFYSFKMANILAHFVEDIVSVI